MPAEEVTTHVRLRSTVKPNRGYLPPEAAGKRVRVLLADGTINRDVVPSTPPGWAADGKGGCRWTLTGRPHDIAEYEVIG